MLSKIIKSIILCLLFSTTLTLAAQDTILLADNTRIGCKVTGKGPKFIEYTNVKNAANIYFTVNKDIVQYIFFNSGEVDTINPVVSVSIPDSEQEDSLDEGKSNKINYEIGRKDALKLFSSPAAIFANGLSGVLLTYGLVTPIIFSWSKVNPNNISVPEYVNSTDAQYKKGFEKGASQKMHRQAWKSFGVGAIVGVATLVALVLVAY